jgi:hypothetical protein
MLTLAVHAKVKRAGIRVIHCANCLEYACSRFTPVGGAAIAIAAQDRIIEALPPDTSIFRTGVAVVRIANRRESTIVIFAEI